MSLLTQVQRRPGSGTILQKFINFGGVDEGASVEQPTDRPSSVGLAPKRLVGL